MASLIDVKDCPCDGCEAKPCGHPARCIKFALWLNKTVDAVEVVHGEWTVIEDDYTDDTIYQCSVCKEEFVTIDDTPADNLWNYCPNCGAKMDLVTECEDDYDYLRDRCYECGGYGDDYYTDENGDLVSACDDCSYNGRDYEDD